MHTASAAMLEALQEAGVSYLFANFGSDHPAILESPGGSARCGAAGPKSS